MSQKRYFSIKQLFMSQKRLTKWHQHFLKNSQPIFIKKLKILYIISDHTNSVQTSPACGSNTYHLTYGKTSNVSISNGNIKCPIGKSNSSFTANLPLKLFLSLQKLTLEVFSLSLPHWTTYAEEIWAKSYGSNIYKILSFLTIDWDF